MDRISAANYGMDGSGHRTFVDKNLATNMPGTGLNALWHVGVQESIIGPVEATGQTPTDADNTQLLKAMKRIGAGGLLVISTAGTTVLTADNAGLVVCDATAGNIVLTLPACNAAGTQAIKYGIWRLDSSANSVTVNTGLVATGGATATMLPGGATSAVLSGASHIELTSDLAAWITSGVVSTGSANSGAYLYSGGAGTATVPASQAGWLLTTHGNEILTLYSPATAAAVGKSMVVYNSDTAWPLQLLAPAGVFIGPFGTGTNSLMVPVGALAVVSADGANFVVSFLSSGCATLAQVAYAVAVAGVVSNHQATFPLSATWVVPAGITTVLVSGCAGGAGANSAFSGGAGQPAIKHPLTVIPGHTLTISIGAAGSGSSVSTGGTGGGNTSIVDTTAGVTLLTLTGASAPAGTISTGWPSGGQNSGSAGVCGVCGASGPFGGGGIGGGGVGGNAYGFGAGGGSGNSNPGGNGAPGVIILEI